ncbi:AmmeMemoRadiSam system radical SAM enzyme [candidate division WOR-3 bacterium]|nr:AmmeMemoRadiSam system radical SAM enzyme [candidate division WOR-3 bacterium]
MNLFFEKVVSRRSFLKKCGLVTLGGAILSKLVKFGNAQEAKIGFIKPQKALYYEKLQKKKIKCLLCPRKCIITKGNRGFCRVRENRDGEYYTLVHSNPCAVHIDPIEKKPLFHFFPGTTALSLATAGCNFTCKNCQNWDISQANPDQTINFEISPERMVNLALEYNAPTIAYTYTEPTVFFEYMLETAKAAKEKNILNMYHSNGFINQKPLLELIPYLDGADIDLKGYSNKFYQDITGGTLYPVLETLKTLKKQGVWLEITNLLIPTKNDSIGMIKDLCQWIKDELGNDTPIHFSRFYPQYKLQNLPPTPIETLKKASEIAHNVGLHYVYIGNVPGIPEENTYCPNCGKIIVGRKGYNITVINLKKNRCKFCKTEIAGRWM